MTHAAEKCEFYAELIKNTQAFKDAVAAGNRSEGELLAGLHRTDMCLSHANPHIRCTIHPRGAEGILDIYRGGEAGGKQRWQAAADVIRSKAAELGYSINCVWLSYDGWGWDLHTGKVHTIQCAVTLPFMSKPSV
jgi:hypothetical protein